MQLLCPACRTPLPGPSPQRAAVLTCSHCSAEVDVSRAGTAAGRPRFVPEIDRTGDTVAGFVLEARVGAGGMGTVYRARRPGDAGATGGGTPTERGSTPVAIKFLSPALASEPEVVARFHREVRLLKSLQHPSIVRVIDHGDENGVPWFAMELVDGPDLRARLTKGPLALEEVGGVFVRLFEALEHAHEKGIIHRDLKPANVLLAPEGAKLADFGIARHDPGAASHATKLTETAAVLGTFPYMSPEQRAGADVDRRSDLFSAGVLLYESLTGKLPQGAFALPSRVNAALPVRLDLVVAKLLQPDRESRYATAADAALALREAIRPRASMAPVIGFGAVAAVALALVVPAVMSSNGGAPGKRAVDRATPPPVAQQAAVLATPSTTPGAAQKVAFLDDQGGGANLPLNSLGTTGTRAENSKSANAKPLAKGDDDDDGEIVQPPPIVGNRMESNFVAQIESQVIAPEEIVPMSTACDPTLVHSDPSSASKIVGKLPKGHAVDRLRTYRRMASLGWETVLGIGAGMPVAAAEPPKKQKAVTRKPAPEPTETPQPELEQQQRTNLEQASDTPAAPAATPAAPAGEVWLWVRYAEKDAPGWVRADCVVERKADKPAYSTGLGTVRK